MTSTLLGRLAGFIAGFGVGTIGSTAFIVAAIEEDKSKQLATLARLGPQAAAEAPKKKNDAAPKIAN